MLIIISLICLYLANVDTYGETLQRIGVALLIFEGIRLWLLYPKKYVLNLEWGHYLITFVIPIISFVVLLMNSEIDLLMQSTLMLLCCVACFAVIERIQQEKLFLLLLCAGIIMTAISIVFASDDLTGGLTLGSNLDGGRVRFAPFNNHPNLTGHIFGLFCIQAGVYLKWNRPTAMFWKLVLVSAILGGLYTAAASSRGAILAVAVSASVVWISAYKSAKFKITPLSAFIIFSATALLIAEWPKLGQYFRDFLEIDSEYRGINSGLSGRAENWPFIVALSMSTIAGFFVGHGIRSWDDNLYGISTDSSYVNTLWESGFFLTILFCLFLMLKIKTNLDLRRRTYINDLHLGLLVFVVTESIFARYLFAIGNPGSIVVLFVLLTSNRAIEEIANVGQEKTY